MFKPTSQHYKDPRSNPVAALSRFRPESRSSQSSAVVQDTSKSVSISEYYNTKLGIMTSHS